MKLWAVSPMVYQQSYNPDRLFWLQDHLHLSVWTKDFKTSSIALIISVTFRHQPNPLTSQRSPLLQTLKLSLSSKPKPKERHTIHWMTSNDQDGAFLTTLKNNFVQTQECGTAKPANALTTDASFQENATKSHPKKQTRILCPWDTSTETSMEHKTIPIILNGEQKVLNYWDFALQTIKTVNQSCGNTFLSQDTSVTWLVKFKVQSSKTAWDSTCCSTSGGNSWITISPFPRQHKTNSWTSKSRNATSSWTRSAPARKNSPLLDRFTHLPK